MRTIYYATALSLLAFSPAFGDELLPAFPGAEGFGAETRGGRGGEIFEVTHLNDDGPGSFRAACEAEVPRIVVFRTGGTIEVLSSIVIGSPFLTIAGQTAPGDGILLKANPGFDGPVIQVASHDLIIRGLRIRRGPTGKKGSSGDGFSINNKENAPHHIVIDHCSVSWCTDENVDAWYAANDITIQWCLISEALHDSSHQKGPHSKGTLIGSEARRISYHHNLLAHNVARNPQFNNDEGPNHVINNVIYNWMYFGGQFEKAEERAPKVNLIGNYYKAGGDSRTNRYEVALGNFPEEPLFYVRDNIGHHRPDGTGDEWAVVGDGSSGLGEQWMQIPASKKIQRHAPWPASPVPVTIHPVNQAFDLVLAGAGAVAPKRDAVDLRVVKDVQMKTGSCINDPSEVGGWPNLNAGEAPLDSDHDGMPDAWETQLGLDPRDPDDRNGKTASGYTRIEEYLNSLIPDQFEKAK
ncbi:MAG: hypothetical protein KA250_13375 [Verrucomicrobiales bacterium]|nr:hypothetical protein [Verrucomicrobiales bacterium]MBP9225441.1 hypothetical protein [Verrucomicrobiales bacterium]HQZ27427.1 hypothetical protein [Verrucomicrobiales bacterium]